MAEMTFPDKLGPVVEVSVAQAAPAALASHCAHPFNPESLAPVRAWPAPRPAQHKVSPRNPFMALRTSKPVPGIAALIGIVEADAAV